MNELVVKVENVSKVIKEHVILEDINLDIEKGKIYGLVGGNGSGKSVLLKIICGLMQPSEGNIYLFGKKIENGRLPNSVGMLVDAPGLLPEYTAFENLKILSSINNTINDENIRSSIELVGLDTNDKRSVRKYSLGMKQKLGIAQAIMENPKFLILDEPMNGLDEYSVKLIRNLICDLKNNGTTIILTSHNSEDIEILCDHIYRIQYSKLQRKK